LLLHVAVLGALQTGLLKRAFDSEAPSAIWVETVPPADYVKKAAPTLVNKAPEATKFIASDNQKSHFSEPQAQAPTNPAQLVPAAPVPSPLQNTQTVFAPSGAPDAAKVTAPMPANRIAVPSEPAKVELPSSDADYLHNPKPPYPSVSKRLGEQGRVVIRTLIGADGVAQQAEIKQSSGFERLDQSALNTALRWRYVPGKRAGVPEAMWFNVPFTFVLE
jgi:protein TonB